MRIKGCLLSVFVLFFFFSAAFPVFAQDSFRKDEILVKLKKTAPTTGFGIVSALSLERARRTLSGQGDNRVYSIKLVPGETVESKIKEASADPAVELAQPNYIYNALEIPDDPLFKLQWSLLDKGQKVLSLSGKPGADIKMPSAWNRATGSKDIVVAVIDSGIDYTHPDLADNVWTNPSPGSEGFQSDIHGINAITGSGDPLDDFGHGSHVSGIIGAVGNNATGICGINWHVSVMALKFLGVTGGGTTQGAVTCINYAVDQKKAGVDIRAINASWGGAPGAGIDKLLQSAIQDASDNGILFVAAAGNSANDNDKDPVYPASFNIPNVISVAATDMKDKLAVFSNFGQTAVHVAAPGVNILSTMPPSLTDNSTPYMIKSGTSMATPHVSGLAALAASVNKSLTAERLKSLILDNVDFLKLPVITGGRINAARTVGAAAGDNVKLEITRQGKLTVMQASLFAEGSPQSNKTVFFYRDGKKIGKSKTGASSSASPGTAILKIKDKPGNHTAFAVSAPFGDVQSISSNIVNYIYH